MEVFTFCCIALLFLSKFSRVSSKYKEVKRLVYIILPVNILVYIILPVNILVYIILPAFIQNIFMILNFPFKAPLLPRIFLRALKSGAVNFPQLYLTNASGASKSTRMLDRGSSIHINWTLDILF